LTGAGARTTIAPVSESKAAEYDAWHERLHQPASRAALHLESWHEAALALAPDRAGRRVLEVGCGAGDLAVALARRGARVAAVDFSAHAVRIARDKARALGAAPALLVADAQRLPFADASFDAIVSCECLEHVPDPRALLRELARLLVPGGTLLLTTESYANAMLLLWARAWLTGRRFDSGAGLQPIEHFFLFFRVRAWIERAGLTVDEMAGHHHVFLVLPRFAPDTFVKERFAHRYLARLFRPLARHMAFRARKR
jgi:ubiquinone/menaquinone biosynthesis C-methylase UbiE